MEHFGIAAALLTNLHQQMVVMHSHIVRLVLEKFLNCQTGFGKVGMAH